MSFAMSYFTDPMVAQKNKAKNTESSIILHKSAINPFSVTEPNRNERTKKGSESNNSYRSL
jgi:hypothetical protein